MSEFALQRTAQVGDLLKQGTCFKYRRTAHSDSVVLLRS